MRVRRLLHIVIAVLALGAPLQAQDLVALATSGMDVCLRNFPNSRATIDALKEAGWRYEGTNGEVHMYSINGRRALIGTAVTSSPNQACLAAIRGLNLQQALQIAAGIAKKLKLTEVKTDEAPGGIAWGGSLNGRTVALVGVKPTDYAVMRGAAIVLIAPKQ